MHVWWNCTAGRFWRQMDSRSSILQLWFVNSCMLLPNNSGLYIMVSFLRVYLKPELIFKLGWDARHLWRSQDEPLPIAFALFEMPTKPECTFIILLRCLQAWSTPIETNGISLLVTDMFPSSSSRHVVWYFVFIWCMSAMYHGQRCLYLIRSNAKKNQLIECISSFQMESKISISGCFSKEHDGFNPVEVIHHWPKHSVRWLPIFPSFQLLNGIFIGRGLK